MKSMTGYGIEYSFVGGKKISCWIKSVNSKYLEIYFDIPAEHISAEPDMRREIRKRVKRGKVEVFIREEKTRFPISFRRIKAEDIFSLFQSALTKFEESREDEGQVIAQDLLQRINKIREFVSDIENLHASFPEKVKAILKERIQQIAVEMGMENIPEDVIDKAGVVHIVRRADISEEITRIKSHIDSFEDEVEREGDGKKLMFIAQEVLRELNTMGAKSLDIRISEKVIEAKLEIERIREQLHNVE